MDVVILAGGKGTRLAPVLGDVPKPMADVAGRPFLERLLDFWLHAGATRFLLSTGYRAEDFKRHFGNAYRGVPVLHAIEHVPLGTGGALLFAVRTLGPRQRFWICNGDTLLGLDPVALETFHRDRYAGMTVAALPSPPEKRYGGLALDGQGKILEFSTAGRAAMLVNGGVYLAEPDFFTGEAVPGKSVSLEEELFPEWIRKGRRLYAFRTDAAFLDIGVPESYARAGDFIKNFTAGDIR